MSKNKTVWIVWENQLRVYKAGGWRFALGYLKGKSWWETITAEETRPADCNVSGFYLGSIRDV